jgi:succinate dehydrogenase / fumarate reductase cytochrome b subunit
MADVERNGRPLSPHLQVYRWQLSMASSILNRITGNALIAGGLLIVWWLVAAATSAEYFALVDWIVTSWIGDLVMVGSVWALWYHALAGVRHLIWDTGRGLGLTAANAMGWGAIVGSVVLTLITVILA